MRKYSYVVLVVLCILNLINDQLAAILAQELIHV
jgi:hypothetical protein